ncbi:cell growth regulator with RING finger domain protein 1-like isoform X4 [Macrobrachium rosenbergii]|uniref:cell growth regulator with RING finger domain protein 1-like isoform X4 n=1 Tax=Macrobrachium rosenbergii TaxID=79674 RepID=UPI0034D71BCD
MVAVLTAALITAAEISSLFSALGVIVCLICMVVFISRVNGEDFFGTSVVHVAQPPVAQVSVQKVAVPFSLELHRPEEIKFSDVHLKIRSDVSYTFRSYWGVMQDHLHSLMGGPWSGFYLDLIENSPLNAEIINEPERCDASDGAFIYKTLNQNVSPSSLSLGSSPRKKYPLVVCMVRQDSSGEEVDPSNVALYTQGNNSSSNWEPTGDATDDDKGNYNIDNDDIPIEEACVVCQTNRITRALLPCRHVCVCSMCFNRLETCPMCRARFQAYFLVAPEDEELDDLDEPIREESRSRWQRMYDTLNNLLLLEN